MQQLSGLDASFLYFETPHAPMHIGMLAIYDPSTAPGQFVRYRDILRTLENRLHLARTFRQRVARVPMDLDHPYWINDPDFDLEYHVRHIALPKPGDWRQLCIQTARLYARPLDITKPLWEMYVIEGLDNVEGLPPGSFALVTKIHHAAIDGVSGAEITGVIHDLEPEGSVPPPAVDWEPDREPWAPELIGRAWMNNLQRPFHFARVMADTVPALTRLTEGFHARRFQPPAPVPRTRFNATVSPHRVVDGRSFPLRALRQIKRAVPGATVNDAVLTLVGGALRHYLDAKGELPRSSLIAMAPVSVRSEDQSQTQGNQVSAMSVALGTEEADPVHAGANASKALTQAIGARLMTDYGQFVPSALAGLAARLYTRAGLANQMQPMFNTVVTNIPGPQHALYMGGARMTTLYGLGPVGDGMGLIHPVFSYCGEITVSFTACREMIPDPAFYSECIDRAFAELCHATGVSAEREPSGAGSRAEGSPPAHDVTAERQAAATESQRDEPPG